MSEAEKLKASGFILALVILYFVGPFWIWGERGAFWALIALAGAAIVFCLFIVIYVAVCEWSDHQ